MANDDAYIEALGEAVESVCGKDRTWEAYWAYDDGVTPEQLRSVLEWQEDRFESPRDTLEERISDDSEGFHYEETELLSAIGDYLSSHHAEAEEVWESKDREDKLEDLELAGFCGIDSNIDQLLDQSRFEVNLLFASRDEWNSDYTSISRVYDTHSHQFGLDTDALSLKDFDNSLTYLLHQQGYTAEDLLERMLFREDYQAADVPGLTSPFIGSVVDELCEAGDRMLNLTALVSLDGSQMLDLIQGMASGKGSITLPKSAMIGLFSRWDGSGSDLGITLEKDAVIPLSLVERFQIERESESHCWGAWTVDEVYGLVGSYWTQGASLSPETVTDPIKEDYRAVVYRYNELCEDCDFVSFAREKHGLELERTRVTNQDGQTEFRYVETKSADQVRSSAAAFAKSVSESEQTIDTHIKR